MLPFNKVFSLWSAFLLIFNKHFPSTTFVSHKSTQFTANHHWFIIILQWTVALLTGSLQRSYTAGQAAECIEGNIINSSSALASSSCSAVLKNSHYLVLLSSTCDCMPGIFLLTCSRKEKPRLFARNFLLFSAVWITPENLSVNLALGNGLKRERRKLKLFRFYWDFCHDNPCRWCILLSLRKFESVSHLISQKNIAVNYNSVNGAFSLLYDPCLKQTPNVWLLFAGERYLNKHQQNPRFFRSSVTIFSLNSCLYAYN